MTRRLIRERHREEVLHLYALFSKANKARSRRTLLAAAKLQDIKVNEWLHMLIDIRARLG